jgi:ribosomal subunit interface protein
MHMTTHSETLETIPRQAGAVTLNQGNAEFPWNFVTKNLVGHELVRKKFREKIGKLQSHLKHFPVDAVHLHIALERHPRKHHHTARLTLRVPSNILHSEKSAPDVIQAFDLAVKTLLRELESLKANLRGEVQWKRRERRQGLRQAIPSSAFTELPQELGEGPQEQGEVVTDFLRQHYQSLVSHTHRHLRHLEQSEEIPAGAIDARDIVDEVVREVMTGWRQRPQNFDWQVWFYQLIREELGHRLQASDVLSGLSLDEVRPTPDQAQIVDGYDAEEPLNIIADKMEPFVAELREMVPDPSALPPDQAIAQKEILELLQVQIQSWPRLERDVFELHFIEGFEAGEVAVVTKLTPGEVSELITHLHRRLRRVLMEEAALDP